MSFSGELKPVSIAYLPCAEDFHVNLRIQNGYVVGFP
jgi:hypothetical protein